MFSTNNSPLILKPLSTSAWPWDNTKMILQTFHKLNKSALACIKLPKKLSKRSLSWSSERNFPLSVTTTELMNLRYSWFAWSASAALRRLNSYKLWISLGPCNDMISITNHLWWWYIQHFLQYDTLMGISPSSSQSISKQWQHNLSFWQWTPIFHGLDNIFPYLNTTCSNGFILNPPGLAKMQRKNITTSFPDINISPCGWLIRNFPHRM